MRPAGKAGEAQLAGGWERSMESTGLRLLKASCDAVGWRDRALRESSTLISKAEHAARRTKQEVTLGAGLQPAGQEGEAQLARGVGAQHIEHWLQKAQTGRYFSREKRAALAACTEGWLTWGKRGQAALGRHARHRWQWDVLRVAAPAGQPPYSPPGCWPAPGCWPVPHARPRHSAFCRRRSAMAA